MINFENGIAELDLATLKETASYSDFRGVIPKNRGMEHKDLIEHICDKASGISGITAEIDPIYCTERQTMQVSWKGMKDLCPLENYLLQRLTTRIQLKDPSDTDKNMAIGISYNEKGITLAFGPNIWICANQNVFGDNIMSTYSQGTNTKMKFENIMEVLNAWMTNYAEKRDTDYSTIRRMENQIVPFDSMHQVYGELLEKGVLSSMIYDANAPMNITQVSQFVRTAHSEEYKIPSERDANVWDLAQIGTSVLAPHKNDFIIAYQTLNNFNNFLLEKYQLN